MKSSRRIPTAAVGRADLLRLLAMWGEGREFDAADLTGFKYTAPDDISPSPIQEKPTQQESSVSADEIPQAHELLRAAHYSATLTSKEPSGDYLKRLHDKGEADKLSEFRQSNPPSWEPLAPERRLTVFAEKYLRRRHPVNLWDVNILVSQLGRGLPPVKRNARQQRLRWSGNAMVIQMSGQTVPLHDDYRAMARVVHRRSGGRVPIYAHYLGRGWSVYEPEADRHSVRQQQGLWSALPGAPLLENMGGLALGWPQESWPEGWRPHAALLAWKPERMPSMRMPPFACWDVNQRLQTKRQLPLGELYATPQQLEQLLALMTLAVNIHPELLRALRCLLGLPAGAEVQAWTHEDVGCNLAAIAVRAIHRERYTERLKFLPLKLRQQAAACIEAHHTRLSRAITLEEAQYAHTHMEDAPVMRPETHFKYIAHQLRNHPESAESTENMAYLARAGNRMDALTWEASPEFTLAWGIANREALENPALLPAHFPPHLWASLYAAVMGKQPPQTVHGLRLRQQDDCLIFDCCDLADLQEPAPLPCNVLAQWPSAPVLKWRTGPAQKWQKIALGQSVPPLDLSKLAPIELTDGQHTCIVKLEQRPIWATEWARDRQSLYAILEYGRNALRVAYPQAKLFTIDADGIGPLAKLTVNNQTQTFRYLPPGQFLMGSPADEPGRSKDEGPQHSVTLTEGLWLADTACTQALWQALMGDNRSQFKGDDLPVECVSWGDVQVFLGKLQALLPAGIDAVLPTEAEWEYACRAGTTTPFSFGANISTEQANYDANFPYTFGPRGKYRNKTVAVKALPANPWGLYQMHGNVWEWCADDRRDYATESEINPRGARRGDSYAVRGGAWVSNARNARSAQRYRWQRSSRDGNLGFRFALRSTSQAGAGGPVLQARDVPDLLAPEVPAAQASNRGGTQKT